jgi:iron complex transport system permease protein
MISALIAASRRPLTLRRLAITLAALGGLLLLICLLGLGIGSVSLSPAEIWASITRPAPENETARTILLMIRLPRVLMAMVVGAALAVAGVVFQALLRNPLAEPYILGISSGGTVGAIVAITLSLGALGVPALSFVGSAAVMGIVYMLAQRRGQLDTYTLLLAGVMIGAFFNAAILLIIAVFHQELRTAFLWLMGNLSGAGFTSLGVVAIPIALIIGLLWWRARAFNLIATGDETALQLGVEVRLAKRAAYLLASLLTGAAVSVSGVVGFVGLIIPHTCRILFGPDHRLLIPASALLGAVFLLATDTLARTLIAPSEIPVGAVTAAIGAPLFVYLLRRS